MESKKYKFCILKAIYIIQSSKLFLSKYLPCQNNEFLPVSIYLSGNQKKREGNNNNLLNDLQIPNKNRVNKKNHKKNKLTLRDFIRIIIDRI